MRRLLAFLCALWIAGSAFAQWQGAGPMVPGSGGSGGTGTITSISTTCPAAGPYTTGAVTLNGQATINAQTGTTYTIATTDCGNAITASNASASTYTWPAANVLPQGFYTVITNIGAGTLAFNPASGGTINGSSTNGTFTLAQYQTSTFICTDATCVTVLASVAKATVSPGGSSGDFQTNNGSGGFGNVTPGTGVATAFANATNSNGGLASQNGAITTGDLVSKSSTGIQDSGFTGASFQAHTGYFTNNWYALQSGSQVTSGAALTANVVYCTPIYIQPAGVTFKTFGVATTANTVTTYGSAAIYKNDGTGGRPGTLLVSSAAWTYTGSGGAPSAAVSPISALVAGTYWACEYNSATPTFIALNSASIFGAYAIGASTLSQVTSSSANIVGVTCTAGSTCGSTAAWSGSTPGWGSMASATWTLSTTTGTMPVIGAQVN